MKYELVKKGPIEIIGISCRTTYSAGPQHDIASLWQRFFQEGWQKKIENRLGEEIFAVYSAYEKDYTAPYTYTLGCPVRQPVEIPSGAVHITIPDATYAHLIAKGPIPQALVNLWKEVWKAPLPRKYTVDFEIYGAAARDPLHASIDLFLAVEPS